MEMPKPGEAHRKLEALVGTWAGEETISPSPWDPAGGKAIGRVQNRSALDGFVVVQDYEQERYGQISFRGHGIFSWHPALNCYLMHWYDSMGSPAQEFRGQFEGKILTLTSAAPPMCGRATFDLGETGRYKFRMDVSQDGTQWSTFMQGAYTRKG